MRTLHFLIDLTPTNQSQSLADKHQDLITTHTNHHLNNDHNNHDYNYNEELNDFMSCIVKILFKIAYCYTNTKEVCHKEGNSLLFAVCSTHPQLIGRVLNEVDLELGVIGKRALYLNDQLPFEKWLPHVNCQQDVAFLQKCLLANVTNSILFRLAVSAIDHIDFGRSTRECSEVMLNGWMKDNDQSNNPHIKSRFMIIYDGYLSFITLYFREIFENK